MNRALLQSLYGRLPSVLRRSRPKTVFLVHDNARWSFYWDAYYLAQGLRNRVGIPAEMRGRSGGGVRNQILHYIDRYALLSHDATETLHGSNELFVTWYHGEIGGENPEMRRLFNALGRVVDNLRKIIVSCERTKCSLVEGGVAVSKVEIIPLGIDLARFTPTTPTQKTRVRCLLGIPENAICIGLFQKDGAGWGDGMEPKLIKGPDVFLEVISLLSRRYRNLFVMLTGPARGYVKRGLDHIGVPYLHRYLSEYHEIVPYYRALDLYIIPSRCEGGPKALLESWATGVPVVSTRMGMPADLIRHGLNGMIAESEDTQSLLRSSCEMLENGSLRERCIGQALRDCQAFDWGAIAEQHYYRLYQPLMQP